MEDILCDLLETLNIPIGHEELENVDKLEEYIVFNVYHDEESNICDDSNLTETYYITINYYYKKYINLYKWKIIRDLLKSNNFKYDGGGSGNGSSSFKCKNMDFMYVMDSEN
ncbi:MAG: hypothetical protein ACRCW0_06700 [Clostridium sp.]